MARRPDEVDVSRISHRNILHCFVAQFSQNMVAYTLKITINIQIRITQNMKSQGRQIRISFLVVGLGRIFVMLGTIQFNNGFCFGAIKINNVISKHFLPFDIQGQMTQKIIPQVAFLLCHFSAKLLRVSF